MKKSDIHFLGSELCFSLVLISNNNTVVSITHNGNV